MNISTDVRQNYWFPGTANHRSIFDFTQDVMQIQTPGFPLVPVDSDNFGNVISLSGGNGYYIIGKYVMDYNFSPVENTEDLLVNVQPTVANCAFAPDLADSNNAQLYFIDKEGLHYVHLKQNILKESTADIISLVSLPVLPLANSPLCILGDAENGGNWLFFITSKEDIYYLASVYCKESKMTNIRETPLPVNGIPTFIDIKNSTIAIHQNTNSLIHGTLSINDNVAETQFIDTISGLSTTFFQSAFSVDGNSLFYVTEESRKYYLNCYNLTTGVITKTPTVGKYIALKCGVDNIIYGLSVKTSASATLLVVTPTEIADQFSISETYVSVSGGYFPSTGWQNR